MAPVLRFCPGYTRQCLRDEFMGRNVLETGGCEVFYAFTFVMGATGGMAERFTETPECRCNRAATIVIQHFADQMELAAGVQCIIGFCTTAVIISDEYCGKFDAMIATSAPAGKGSAVKSHATAVT